MTFKQYVTCMVHCIIFYGSIQGRSPFRTPDPLVPSITTYYKSSPQKKFCVANAHFRLYPLFAFGMDDIKAHLLPKKITFRNDPTQTISDAEISLRIEKAIQEIKKYKRKVRSKKPLTYFTILQDKNFSYRNACGLLVLKFKEYPFVLKLFMENPETICNPYATGIEPTVFFYMGGGVNRHLSGITRIKNLNYINTCLSHLPEWKNKIELPRKWFWLPIDHHPITIIGSNFEDKKNHQTILPGIYAIIADAMQCKNLTSSLSSGQQRSLIMKLCNDVQGHLDPHFDNYGFSDDPITQFKIVIIDTEHILTMVGVSKYENFETHTEWYAYLVGKCFSDMYLQTKDQLIKMQPVGANTLN